MICSAHRGTTMPDPNSRTARRASKLPIPAKACASRCTCTSSSLYKAPSERRYPRRPCNRLAIASSCSSRLRITTEASPCAWCDLASAAKGYYAVLQENSPSGGLFRSCRQRRPYVHQVNFVALNENSRESGIQFSKFIHFSPKRRDSGTSRSEVQDRRGA